ncbi:hypothetical protein LCGC14_0742430 [marine sediment metagenome]|uniref:Uncharacterized protein n=1 Tax=marine sediment metagenome TaxID=412755 RepID=A0A0F9Q6C7_9ZZZZ
MFTVQVKLNKSSDWIDLEEYYHEGRAIDYFNRVSEQYPKLAYRVVK